MSAADVRDALHRARAAINDAERLAKDVPPAAVPPEVTDESVKVAELAYALHPDATDGCTITGPMRAALDAFLSHVADRHAVPQPARCPDCRHERHEKDGCTYTVRHDEDAACDVLCHCATGRVEPTQADALRAAAALVEMVDDLAQLSVEYNHVNGLTAMPSFGPPSLDDLAALRALAERFGVAMVDGYEDHDDSRYVRPEIKVTVDGVVVSIGLQVSTADNPDVAAQARAWIAEAASC